MYIRIYMLFLFKNEVVDFRVMDTGIFFDALNTPEETKFIRVQLLEDVIQEKEEVFVLNMFIFSKEVMSERPSITIVIHDKMSQYCQN